MRGGTNSEAVNSMWSFYLKELVLYCFIPVACDWSLAVLSVSVSWPEIMCKPSERQKREEKSVTHASFPYKKFIWQIYIALF